MSCHKGYLGMVRIDPAPGESLYINSFTFDTFDNLIAFTRSRGRNKLLAKLNPMLESTSAYEINEERLMGNAWSELFVATGGRVPSRPPPLWKSCILTICPLFILVFQLGTPLGGYLAEANIEPHFATLIIVAVMVFLMTYFAVPTMQMFFGKWLNMPRGKPNPRFKHLEYFEFLDTGIPMYMQIVVLITFILANVLSADVSE
jgi:antibiotic biosynthesis monooxygenase (ABM) superfamily enzyme